MLTLPDLQRLFGQALLTDNETALSALEPEIASSSMSPRERLAIYRNNVLASLTDVLRETFPVVCRLVGEPFFAFAAREFIAAHPPLRPSLSDYGDAFPAFLGTFPPCSDLAYLADTARLEWLLNVARYAADVAPVSARCLSATAEEDAARLVFRFHPACGYHARHDNRYRSGHSDSRPVQTGHACCLLLFDNLWNGISRMFDSRRGKAHVWSDILLRDVEIPKCCYDRPRTRSRQNYERNDEGHPRRYKVTGPRHWEGSCSKLSHCDRINNTSRFPAQGAAQ
jgi:hypothetical protein